MAASFNAGVTRRRRDDLLWSVERADSTTDMLTAASTRLRHLVPFDAAAWVSTDPASGLPNGPTLLDGVEGVSPAQCSEHWRRELLGDDVNLFTDLAAAPVAAGTLRRAIDDPHRSRRYRTFLRPLGFGDELRAVLRAGHTPWGTVTLMRRDGQPEFSARDTKLVAGLSEPLGDALRPAPAPLNRCGSRWSNRVCSCSTPTANSSPSTSRPAAGSPRSRPTGHCRPSSTSKCPCGSRSPSSRRAPGPPSGATVRPAAVCAPAAARGWCCHATCLRTVEGTGREIAVVIEPARPADIAPIVVEAYDLTDREQQITRLIARGSWDCGDRRRAVPVATHRARPRQSDLPQARRHQSW